MTRCWAHACSGAEQFRAAIVPVLILGAALVVVGAIRDQRRGRR